LRDYGEEVETVWGGDKECEHIWGEDMVKRKCGKPTQAEGIFEGRDLEGIQSQAELNQGNFCQKCGAWKGQLGLEPTPDLYVKHLMEIFNELKKVLKPTGLFFLNIGDTYSGSGGAGGDWREGSRAEQPKWSQGLTDLPDKCMSMIPERVMMAMVDNGWILRNKIIWNKPNPMPESVKDRFSTGYEFVYMFSLNKRYYFDLDAVREPHETQAQGHAGCEKANNFLGGRRWSENNTLGKKKSQREEPRRCLAHNHQTLPRGPLRRLPSRTLRETDKGWLS